MREDEEMRRQKETNWKSVKLCDYIWCRVSKMNLILILFFFIFIIIIIIHDVWIWLSVEMVQDEMKYSIIKVREEIFLYGLFFFCLEEHKALFELLYQRRWCWEVSTPIQRNPYEEERNLLMAMKQWKESKKKFVVITRFSCLSNRPNVLLDIFFFSSLRRSKRSRR